MTSSTAIAIIPARFASSRFPGKPLAQIHGKSLLQRAYESAAAMPFLQEVVIATDDERIAEHGGSFGAKVVLTSAHCLNGTERVAEVIEKSPELQAAEIVVNLQGDEPFIAPGVVSAMLELLQEDERAVMATAASLLEQQEAASSVKCVTDICSNALYFSRALIPANKEGAFDHKIGYYRHLGVYAYRRDFLLQYPHLAMTPLATAEDLEQLKVLEHGFRIKVALVPKEWHLGGVDYPQDIQRMEHLLCNIQNTSSSPGASSPH